MSTLAANNIKLGRAYVPTSACAISVEFSGEMIHVHLGDGRIISVPIIWFPALRNASPAELARCEIGAGGHGLHWPELDEDLSIAGLMAGVDRQAA